MLAGPLLICILGIFPLLSCVSPHLRYRAEKVCSAADHQRNEIAILEINRRHLAQEGSPDTVGTDARLEKMRSSHRKSSEECRSLRRQLSGKSDVLQAVVESGEEENQRQK